jgi:hypothetical protein
LLQAVVAVVQAAVTGLVAVVEQAAIAQLLVVLHCLYRLVQIIHAA